MEVSYFVNGMKFSKFTLIRILAIFLQKCRILSPQMCIRDSILYLQGIELGYWKRGIPATLSLLKDAVKKKSAMKMCIRDSPNQSVYRSYPMSR